MSKKKQSSGIGRSLIKDRFGKKNRPDGETFLHTSELQDGYDWGRLNLQSVTEQNNLDDFLATAELAGTEFTAEKLNIKFVAKDTGGLPRAEELLTIQGLHKDNEQLLKIPRRPPWTADMTTSQVDFNERMSFLEWRRSLAKLQEDERIIMTPYEKNLNFWRQLWRVIERSDIVVQIVDARNPLLFYCADLEVYIREVNRSKVSMVLVNKADFLNDEQRDMWAEYFSRRGIRIAFWSAVDEAKRLELIDNLVNDTNNVSENNEDKVEEDENSDDNDLNCEDSVMDEDDIDDTLEKRNETDRFADENVSEHDETIYKTQEVHTEIDTVEPLVTNRDVVRISGSIQDDMTIKGGNVMENDDSMCKCDHAPAVIPACSGATNVGESHVCGLCNGLCNKVKILPTHNTGHIYTGPELIDLFKSLHTGKKMHEGLTTVGMVGYPNVGKSSTINAILNMKKVPVSATPGRTKHFQTLYLDSSTMLCDCPGLVFPSFVNTKADLVVNGILPVDQMRDYLAPTSLLCLRIPRWIFEKTYGIIIPVPGEGEDPDRAPTAYELLNAYGAMRGYMNARGTPDAPRASRYLLKDYVNGKLLFCHPPQGVDEFEFNGFNITKPALAVEEAGRGNQGNEVNLVNSKVDSEFFKQNYASVHMRSAKPTDTSAVKGPAKEKPWKKHNNRNKREKIRRVFGHLDA